MGGVCSYGAHTVSKGLDNMSHASLFNPPPHDTSYTNNLDDLTGYLHNKLLLHLNLNIAQFDNINNSILLNIYNESKLFMKNCGYFSTEDVDNYIIPYEAFVPLVMPFFVSGFAPYCYLNTLVGEDLSQTAINFMLSSFNDIRFMNDYDLLNANHWNNKKLLLNNLEISNNEKRVLINGLSVAKYSTAFWITNYSVSTL